MAKKDNRDDLPWFIKLFTLGDRFDIQDFFDRLKKSVLEFLFWFLG